ncbi:MAG: Slp family lipoprotein [Nitrospirales bacterium]|nr:Slp family lipoprotein [Nitrospirales bacterium]
MREVPEQYRGRLLVVGGTVLALKHEDQTTRLDLHRLPVTNEYVPLPARTTSRDRFFAVCSGSVPLGPDLLRPGTTVTIIGKIKGSQPIMIGETTQAVPVFDIKDLTIWKQAGQESPGVNAGNWFSPLYIPYGYHPAQWSNC